MSDGFFVTVEGVDGSGTTTVSNALAEEFDGVLTTEPSDQWTGEQVRRCIDSDSGTHELTDFFMFMADRVEHVENVVRPSVEDGEIVVSDRYADSTRAYQREALAEHMPRSVADKYIKDVMNAFSYEPDLTLWLDADVDDTFERTGGDEKFEKEQTFQECVRQNYYELFCENDRIVRIDADRSEQEVIRVCADVIDSRISMNRLETHGLVEE